MEINQLRAFITVAREKNLTRSSDLLHITQPALSSQIKKLEIGLGVSLFDRHSRGMELTECGARLLEKAIHILDEIESLESNAQELRGYPSGKIFLGINAGMNVLRVDELSSLLSTGFPQIEIHLIQSTSREIKDLIRKRKLDCGFVFGENPDSDIADLRLCDMNLCVVAHSQLKQIIKKNDLTKLESRTWVMRSEQCPFFKVLMAFFREKNIRPAKIIFTNQDQVVHDLIRTEKGVSLLLEADALALQRKGRAVIVPHDPFKISLSLAYHESRPVNPALQTVLDTIRKIWNGTTGSPER